MRYVYVIGNLINWKVYVGQTKNFKTRTFGHMRQCRIGNLRPLYASMRKHGINNFVFNVLEECVDELINEREQFWVAHFDSFNPERGYNLTPGGASEQRYSVDIIEQRRKTGRRVMTQLLPKLWSDENFRRRAITRLDKLRKSGKITSPDWHGRKHTSSTRYAIGRTNSVKQRGQLNSQYGTMWISNVQLKISRKIKRSELEKYLLLGWSLGRKVK